MRRIYGVETEYGLVARTRPLGATGDDLAHPSGPAADAFDDALGAHTARTSHGSRYVTFGRPVDQVRGVAHDAGARPADRPAPGWSRGVQPDGDPESARTPWASGWQRLGSDEAAQRLFAPLARAHSATNVFLPNGGRLYLDVGNHPEYATPECDSIADLLVAERAGDELLVELADQARALEADQGRDTEFTLVKNNVDSFGNTYGSHENYLIARDTDLDSLTAWLVPFLVSRQAIAGAGRWHRGHWTISQRCDALAGVVSHHSTRNRPLINARDEPHADPRTHRRLHVISGDSNLDETSAWLRYGATELVLRLAESGRPAPFTLDDPLDALRRWGREPAEAIDLQHRYAELAADVAGPEGGLADVQRRWAGGAHTPEWAHKRALIDAYRARHDLTETDPRLDALDLRWHTLGPSQGRPDGLARLAEARGSLPRLTSPDAVAAAHAVAPSATRARLRGRLVESIRTHERDAVVDWGSVTVHDLPAKEVFDDPFSETDPRADALATRMADEPRRRLGGFNPPPV